MKRTLRGKRHIRARKNVAEGRRKRQFKKWRRFERNVDMFCRVLAKRLVPIFSRMIDDFIKVQESAVLLGKGESAPVGILSSEK